MFIALLLVLVIALPASAHPGKTDRYGGHKCHKECAEWDLYYAEYHLHDKDGRPVKVARKKQARSNPAAAAMVDRSADRPVETTLSPPVAAVATVITEPDTLSLPWVLLALFLLLFLVVRRNRRKGAGVDRE